MWVLFCLQQHSAIIGNRGEGVKIFVIIVFLSLRTGVFSGCISERNLPALESFSISQAIDLIADVKTRPVDQGIEKTGSGSSIILC